MEIFLHKPPMSHVSLEELGGPHHFLNDAFDAWACHCWDRILYLGLKVANQMARIDLHLLF